MPEDMAPDNIDIIKPDGKKFENIKAYVQGRIIIERGDIIIESGDFIQRKMSNGGTETYEVLDPCFYECSEGFPAHYQIKYKKMGIPEKTKQIKNIIYNINGNNSKINQNSIDNSTNIVYRNPDILSLLQDLRTEICKLSLVQEEKQNALDIVHYIEMSCQTEKPSKHVISTLLNALPHIESLTTIINNIRSFLG